MMMCSLPPCACLYISVREVVSLSPFSLEEVCLHLSLSRLFHKKETLFDSHPAPPPPRGQRVISPRKLVFQLTICRDRLAAAHGSVLFTLSGVCSACSCAKQTSTTPARFHTQGSTLTELTAHPPLQRRSVPAADAHLQGAHS